jgi:K+-transporting ATPase ATPase A chain
MMVLFLAGVLLCWWAEAKGNPIHQQLGVAAADGNMEGKEVRFGIFNSALFATVTTDASCGAVNSMHDSFTGAGRFCPAVQHPARRNHHRRRRRGALRHARLRRAGGLHRRADGRAHAGIPRQEDPVLRGEDGDAGVAGAGGVHPGLSAWASVSKWGLAGLNNAGPHGLSEILYAYSSANGNNGSAFAGLSANTPWYNTTLGLAMLIGRFLMIVPILAMAGSLAQKKIAPPSAGTFPVRAARSSCCCSARCCWSAR